MDSDARRVTRDHKDVLAEWETDRLTAQKEGEALAGPRALHGQVWSRELLEDHSPPELKSSEH